MEVLIFNELPSVKVS